MRKRRTTITSVKDAPNSLGARALAAAKQAVARTTKASRALPLPGEGDERPFRNWLRSNLLEPVMGWPAEKVRMGEGFDVLLLDENDRAVVTIETKAPFHRASEKERADFERRLKRLPTLRTAYFTNGPLWDRLDLISPQGVPEIRAQLALDLSIAGAEEAESFFTPLRGDRYFRWGKRNRSLVSRTQVHILEQLARDLDEIVADIAGVLNIVYTRYDQGEAGGTIRLLTHAIFDDWCSRSLQPPIGRVSSAVRPILNAPAAERSVLADALREQGFSPNAAEQATDALLMLSKSERRDPLSIRSALAPAYEESATKLCAQSAHLILARCLVYRVGEDTGVFEPLLGGSVLERALQQDAAVIGSESHPALVQLETVRRRMEHVLPVVYQLGDLDWWLVPPDERSPLQGSESGVVEVCDAELDRSLARALRRLDDFHFAKVDADVWRNVYQNYLPGEERQRLGGYYTPEPLVELILDLAGYTAASEGVCQLTIIDPACGSGAFVSIATARLLKHLSQPMACHEHLSVKGRRSVQWQRDKAILDTVLNNVHGIDIHPFAAFLTTLNLTFLLLPLYASVRSQNPSYSLSLQVFSADSLEKPDEQSRAVDMFERLNSRIQLTADSYERYRALVAKSFDLVVGNPPWGGVLKGPLAPVYDDAKKKRLKREYPNAAVGKFDVYGLFMERAFDLLRDGARFAMVTQDTYLDKEWAGKLRRLVATQCQVDYIIDLNPFGNIFFRAMNTPAVTVFTKRASGAGSFVAVTTEKPKFADASSALRQLVVVDAVREAVAALGSSRRRAVSAFCTAARLPRVRLIETAPSAWDLSPSSLKTNLATGASFLAAHILEPRQGVTPGCLDVVLLSTERAKELGLEKDLCHRALKSREAERWSPAWRGRVLLYPYTLDGDVAQPAFALKNPRLPDALEFDVVLDQRERELRRGRALDNQLAREIIEHRIALGLVKYPNAARYLAGHFTRLDGRVYKKKRLSAFGRQWYEYIWPRDARLLLSSGRILSPRLVKEVRFAVDMEGFLADDACLHLLPTDKNRTGRELLRDALSKIRRGRISDHDLLLYCVAFLNSPYAQAALERRRRTPKGFYQITDRFLSEVPIGVPSQKEDLEALLDAVRRLSSGVPRNEQAAIEAQLGKLTMRLLSH